MDVVVNSQVQSPFVRTLESISTKGAAFTHHIPDNVPPVSMHKVAVPFGNAGVDYLSKTVSCTIPQYGYLQRVVIKYTVTITTGTHRLAKHVLTPYMAYALTNMCELRTRNRPIQTMYGREMLMRALRTEVNSKRLLQMSDAHIVKCGNQSYGGIKAIIGSENDFRYGSVSYSEASDYAVVSTVLQEDETYTLVCYVELPLASTMSLAHAFNTRFVEPLTLTLTTGGYADIFPCYNAVRSQNRLLQKSPPTVTAEALCYFLNYHDLTEQDIRNANFRPDAPAVVKAYDTLVEPTVEVTPAQDNTGLIESKEVSIPIRSTVFTYGMSVCASVPDRHPDQPSIVGIAMSLCSARNVYVEDAINGTIAQSYSQTLGSQPAPTDLNGDGELYLRLDSKYYWAIPMFFFSGYQFSSAILSGSGQQLLVTNTVESAMSDSFDHALSTWTNKGRDTYGLQDETLLTQQARAANISPMVSSMYNQGSDVISISSSGGHTGGMYFNFGLSRNETYNSGGLGLQTIANPTLKLKVCPTQCNHPWIIWRNNDVIGASGGDAVTYGNVVIGVRNTLYNLSGNNNEGVNLPSELPFSDQQSSPHTGQTIFTGTDKSVVSLFPQRAGGDGSNSAIADANRRAFNLVISKGNGGVIGVPKLQVYTYIHHHALIQIDSGTGAITRSIDA